MEGEGDLGQRRLGSRIPRHLALALALALALVLARGERARFALKARTCLALLRHLKI